MLKMIKNLFLILITGIAITYLILYIPFVMIKGFGLIGAMGWCIAGIWTAIFILANFVEA